MPIHKVDEKSVHSHLGEYGTTVPVRVQIEGCCVLLRQGAVHAVPSAALQRAH